MADLLKVKAPVWLPLLVYAIVMLYHRMEHSERQQQTRDLDRRVFQLENPHVR